ncbi:MAG TPA: TetR/AcrR family transcriptional regulator [Polyangiaceae bacterium]|nr:TetR/AcrR family transcriptional regulator [Polyangiaceae bacterium]
MLDAAVRALAKRGYAKTSVSDIAHAAGMSKGAVHYHFDSKDDLIAKVLEHCAAVSRERIREAWEKPGAPAERIQRALNEMRAMRKEGLPELRVLADLSAQGIHDPRIKSLLGHMFEVNRKQMTQHLVDSLNTLGLRSKVPPQIVVRLMMGALDGLAMHDYFDPLADVDDTAIELALQTIGISLFET